MTTNVFSFLEYRQVQAARAAKRAHVTGTAAALLTRAFPRADVLDPGFDADSRDSYVRRYSSRDRFED
jgi:hypothetical protein